MELRLYLEILHRRWWLVVAVPLLIALLSLAAALTRPPRYGLTTRLLVTRTSLLEHPPATTSGVDTEDRVAYDLPAIISSGPFAGDVAAELARRGHPLSQAEVAQALRAENEQQLVRISVSAAAPDDAVAIANAAIVMIETNGLRYWGDAQATPANPGINVAVLDPPAQASRLNGLPAIAQEVFLRALLGLVAAIGIVFALHYLEGRPAPREAAHQETKELTR